jgi:hypothetical protein
MRVKSHSAGGNCTLRVEITLVRVEITLVSCENWTLSVEITLFRAEITAIKNYTRTCEHHTMRVIKTVHHLQTQTQ